MGHGRGIQASSTENQDHVGSIPATYLGNVGGDDIEDAPPHADGHPPRRHIKGLWPHTPFFTSGLVCLSLCPAAAASTSSSPSISFEDHQPICTPSQQPRGRADTMALDQYTYVFAIGTFFAMLDAYNNGANDVANAWATSVSSRSITYRQAMIFGTIFEMLGAITVGARTAETIKNGIIPNSAFNDNAGVQMLAFTCALAAASSWVMWCTRHSAHVSSTYSLISAVAGVGVATAGADKVQWGWNKGKGLGAIFAGLGMAPAISGCFGAIIFMLIKLVVHVRHNPVPWAVWTSPFFFLIAGTVCTLSIVYKGSPNLGLNKKPSWYIAAVTMGTGGGLAVVAALFFVPFVHAKVVKKDYTLKWWHFIQGPLLFKRPAPPDAEKAKVPNYAVVQDDDEDETLPTHESPKSSESGDEPLKKDTNVEIPHEKTLAAAEIGEGPTYKQLQAEGEAKLHAKLMQKRGPLGWAMRTLRDNPMGPGQVYELHNMKIILKRIPAMIVVGALYGLHYDIHAAQTGVAGTPEGERMKRVYGAAKKYPNEVEHTYSFVQIITACTASFAHGANDIGNSVGPWAVIYSAWSTGDAAAAKAPVPVWQLAVLSATISLGLITYGYNIMKVMGNKITYHSPSRGSSMEMGAAITVLVFSQFSLPVSTSMCITGATVGVGLCNGSLKAVNFQRVGLLVFSWIMTIPVAGTLGGVLMGLFLNAPHF
ncbi:sodium phosphate [Colletotrichum musicola]|uniref:Phosphate transporter n=1 Tax=Colletotrichum musicola TaxID=2175873 RepID=A0A8H6U6G0_9PEZI|nr:sodium phosphate [Colletotrichum musicola]